MRTNVTNSGELPLESLASLDKAGRRVSIHPAAVSGRWKARRVRLQAVLLVIFLVLPWIKINGLQSILIDIPSRRFTFFGIGLWAHDAPLLLLLFASFAFSIAAVTTVWGRVWCGWACPQTVFIERVFRQVETWIEGSYLSRRELDRAPWTKRKLFLRAAKWSAFTALSMILAHSLLAYFVGVERLAEMVRSSPRENWSTFLMMAVLTACVLFNFGWFREQFCIIMCPYGKIQSLFTDVKTLTVAYDFNRGEPRRGSVNFVKGQNEGDCVSCLRCVKACPTGVDIRRGSQQLECIGCTACMDACDDVMAKTKKAPGLIRYASDRELQKRTQVSPFAGWRAPKPLVLTLFALVSMTALAVSLAARRELKITALRAVETPYQVVTNETGGETVINHFKVDIRNQGATPKTLTFAASGVEGVKLVTALPVYRVAQGTSERIDVFVQYPRAASTPGLRAELLVNSDAAQEPQQSIELRLIGPNGGSENGGGR
ncbi:MAG TPA: cytochrome c oxidase accessory protein CcoG [Bdellovibrionales bacterium]|nr:cytochrome c oxidase accessory protein CcoG [Bdellovibrionales bacterium]